MYTMQSLDKPELAALRADLPDLAILSVDDWRLRAPGSDGGKYPFPTAQEKAAASCAAEGDTGCGDAASDLLEKAETEAPTAPLENTTATWWAANLWMGGRATRAQPHYDQAHNVFVQVCGRKTVWLAPPENIPDFYLYPDLHPAARQSKVCI